jgi:hypothetical protein
MASVQPAVQATGRLLDDVFLKYLPAPLREPRRAWLAILTGWALSMCGSLLLAGAWQLVAPDLKGPEFPFKGWPALFALVAFAPFVETLIMALLIWLFERFMRTPHAILASSALWGVAHSLEAGGWGLVIWWPFLIFSTLYVVWRQRGFWMAVGIVTVTHALQNLIPGIAVAFG